MTETRIETPEAAALREQIRDCGQPFCGYCVTREAAASKLDAQSAEIERLRAALVEADAGLLAVRVLMNESRGVAGLHRNGDIAPWSDLETGGRFAGWLFDFDTADASRVVRVAALSPRAESEDGK